MTLLVEYNDKDAQIIFRFLLSDSDSNNKFALYFETILIIP